VVLGDDVPTRTKNRGCRRRGTGGIQERQPVNQYHRTRQVPPPTNLIFLRADRPPTTTREQNSRKRKKDAALLLRGNYRFRVRAGPLSGDDARCPNTTRIRTMACLPWLGARWRMTIEIYLSADIRRGRGVLELGRPGVCGAPGPTGCQCTVEGVETRIFRTRCEYPAIN